MNKISPRTLAPQPDDRWVAAPISVSWFRSVEPRGCDARQAPASSGVQPARRNFVTHTHAALAFCTAGSSTFEQNGSWQVGPGDVMLVPAGQPHRRVSSAGASYWGLGVCAPCFARDDDLQRVEPFERVRDGGSAVVHIPEARRSFLEHLFRELATVTQRPQQLNAAVIQRSLLLLILNEVSLVANSNAADSIASSRDVVVDSLRYIERNCLQPLTLQDVAKAVGRSPAYVTTALSRNTGRSAVTWIISGRMSEARRLLIHSSESVNAIAERVGYADVTHFIRMFRREHGQTPAAFRARAALQAMARS